MLFSRTYRTRMTGVAKIVRIRHLSLVQLLSSLELLYHWYNPKLRMYTSFVFGTAPVVPLYVTRNCYTQRLSPVLTRYSSQNAGGHPHLLQLLLQDPQAFLHRFTKYGLELRYRGHVNSIRCLCGFVFGWCRLGFLCNVTKNLQT